MKLGHYRRGWGVDEPGMKGVVWRTIIALPMECLDATDLDFDLLRIQI